MQTKQLCHSHLFGSVLFLLSWTPSMMEKELAGSNSSLSSSYKQWAAVRANLLPIYLIMMVIQQIRKYAALLGDVLTKTLLHLLLMYSALVSSSRRSAPIHG